jgi:phosphatidylglycerol:prolipoprotein diacylglycerol transferase
LFEEENMTGPLVAFHLGPLTIYWYGIILVTGMLVGGYVAAFEAKRRGENEDHVWNMLIVVVLLGIVGARLYHVFSSPAGGNLGWAYYRVHPGAIFFIWDGGLGIYGAIVGGLIGVLLYTYRNKLSLLRYLDIGAPALLIGQAIGRWGNWANQELYGPPTTLPWGITIDQYHRIPPFDDLIKYPLTTRFQPDFLYESLWSLVGVILLLAVGRKFAGKLKEGDLFLAYLVWYPLGRLWVEALRPDAWRIGNIPTAQIISVVLIVIAIVLLLIRHLNRRTLKPAESG